MSYCPITNTFDDYEQDPRYIEYNDFTYWYDRKIALLTPEEIDYFGDEFEDIYLDAMYHWCDNNNYLICDEGVFDYNIMLDEQGNVIKAD